MAQHHSPSIGDYGGIIHYFAAKSNRISKR